MNFKEWLLEEFAKGIPIKETRNNSQFPNYPSGSNGIELYPPGYFTSSDALYYMSIDKRFYLGKEGPPNDIRHLDGMGGKEYTRHTKGDGPPFSIKKLKK